jgi:hypothetical protein
MLPPWLLPPPLLLLLLKVKLEEASGSPRFSICADTQNN